MFGARLHGQAGVGIFFMEYPNCKTNVYYTNEILRDVLTRGIIESDVQLDLLGDCSQNMPMEGVLKFVEGKQAGKRSASRLSGAQSVDASRIRTVRISLTHTKHRSILMITNHLVINLINVK